MDTAEDKRIQEMIVDYALRKATHGAYKTQLYSVKHSAPVILVVAVGEQALALDAIIMKAQVPDEKAIKVVSKFNN